MTFVPFSPRYLTSIFQFRRLVSLCLILVLLSNQVLAMPQGFIALGHEIGHSLAFWWYNSGWAAKFAQKPAAAQDTKGWDGKGAPPHTPPDPEPQEKQADRERKVARIEILPRDVTIHTGERVIFSVVAYDRDGSLVTGISVKWEGSDEEKKRPKRVWPHGEFMSPIPGKYKVTAEMGGRKDSVKVTVIGDPLNPSDKGVKGDPISTKDAPKNKISLVPRQSKQRRMASGSAPSASESKSLRRADTQLAQVIRKGLQASAKPMAMATAVQGGNYDYYTWNPDNYLTADDPGKEVGQMPGHALDGGAGSGNFQFAAPIIGLDGRGIDLNLALNYNSRVWHKSGTDMYFNIDGDWLPGWTMGFGRIVTAGSGYMLIDGDGTRHSFGGVPRSYSAPNTSLQGFDGYTQDGSFINYWGYGYRPQYGSLILDAWAKLPNGTKIQYGASANLGAYPTRITDANGNYITITYKSNQGPNIETITDTLGRQIRFYYDANNLLTAITAPGFNGGASRIVARFTYDTAYLSTAGTNYGFSGVNCRVKSNQINRLKAIYYPATNTGYWFGDADSYSYYGMLRKISERRAMTFSGSDPVDPATGPTPQGTIGMGVMSREMVYSSGGQSGYDSNSGSSASGLLTSEPTYSQMAEDWYGRQTTSAPVTTYSVQDLGSTRKIRITRPDGVISEQITDNSTSSQTYGLLLEDKTFADANATIPLHSSKVYWEVPNQTSYPTCNGAPRPYRTEITDERGQMTYTLYSYSTNLYNQVTDVCEYGYNNQFLRRTHTDYINTQNYVGYWNHNTSYGAYVGRHIFNLSSAVSVYASENDDSQRVSRTEYQYDQQSLMNTPSVAQHERASDPFDPGDTYCDWVWNEQTYTYDYVCNTYPVYDSGTDYRGNVTSIKRYADAAGLTSSTAVTETHTFDICGNLRTVSTACCEQTSFNYTINTQFAWPSSQTRGSASDGTKQNTASAVYDFNTGLVNNATDANGRTSTIEYYPDTLRPKFENSSTGGYAYHEYYDNIPGSNNMAVIDFVYKQNTSGSTWANRVDKYLDEHGRVVAELAFTVGFAMDVVDTKYDNLGRMWQQTRPYRRSADWQTNDDQHWTTYAYDKLDRVTSVTTPDGSTSYRYYNQQYYTAGANAAYPSAASSATAKGSTVLAVDSWGRERWARFDEQNRLVEIVEPDPNGNGTVASNGLLTQYTYNTLGSLTLTTQGAQERKFKYDDLGRLTAQKLAEREGTLNDNGDYVGGSTGWSDVFKYDTRSNLIEKTDARGVKTTFVYNNDPLNRLQEVQYNKSLSPFASDIVDAANITYVYETDTSKDKMRLKNVTLANGFGNQAFTYHATYDQLTRVEQSFPDRGTLTTDYEYDSLDRVNKIKYPAQHGFGSALIKEVVPTYDEASRLQSLSYSGTTMAANPVYNASSLMTQLNIGSALQERYIFDAETGLLTQQQVVEAANPNTSLVDLEYNYTLNNAANNVGAKTGQLAFIKDKKNTDRNRAYTYDMLGRLKQAQGGTTAPKTWTHTYSYDRYGNRETVTKSGNGADNQPIPMDGLASLSYDTPSNRINTSGFEYDKAGNQTRANLNDSGSVKHRYKYDAAGRLAQVTDDGGGGIATYSYGASNQRLRLLEGGADTYYSWAGGSVIAEYTGTGTSGWTWSKSYVYLGGRLLATENASGIQYHHPDRLGTRLVTNTSGSVVSENIGLPFGATITGESTNLAGSASKKRFTSYDRSDTTTLDYAVNRHYSAAQGRFTQVDPIGMSAVSLSDPQSLNLYAYCLNDPINHTDPSGLFLKKLFGGIGKAFKWAFRIAAVIVAVIAVMALGAIGQYWGSILITKGLVAALFASSAILATAGWAPGIVGQIAGAIITAGLSWGSNAHTPPINGSSGVSGVSNFIQTQDKVHQAGKIAEVEVTAKISKTRKAWEWLKKATKVVGKGVAKGVSATGSFAFDLFFDWGNTTLGDENDVPPRRIALGLDDYLDEFAKQHGAFKLLRLYGDDWKNGLYQEMNNGRTIMLFNLTDVEVWPGVTRAARGIGGPTDWELLQIKQNPQWWDRIRWYENGQLKDNPFR